MSHDHDLGSEPDGPATEPLKFETKVRASAETLRKAFTDPDMFRAWWTGGGMCALTKVEIDGRRGGAYAMSADAAPGGRNWANGLVLHATDKLIAATFQTRFTRGPASVFFIRIRETKRGRVHVLVEHEGIRAAPERRAAEHMWPQLLAALGAGAPWLDGDQTSPEVAAYLQRNPDCV